MTKKDFENLEIGKTFVVCNKTLKVKKAINLCQGCYFEDITMYCKECKDYELIPTCARKDHHVIFTEVK
ncbi:hypothetical protein [uncultured Fusobacterium sp.]|uniref:hypothetical protein n=1 Tax=uncultured Fusobacterium sp. TaxID=159267 RepID=UPI0025FE5BCA|nr:hypothetical protein [uncultured Fusobacterium sp.]